MGRDGAKGVVEEFFKECCGAVGVGVGESGATGGGLHAEVLEFAFAGVEACGDFTQTFGLCFLTKEHGYEVIPTAEAFGVLFTIGLFDKLGKMMAIDERKQLAKKAGCGSIHTCPPCACGSWFIAPQL